MLQIPDAVTAFEVWENGEREHPIDRALTILGAFTGEPRAKLAQLGVHRRDALLLQSRVLAFGPIFQGVAQCAACPCEIDVAIELSDLDDASAPEGGALEIEGAHIAYRVPNSFDLAAIAGCSDVDEAERRLRERCITADSPLGDALVQAVDGELGRLCASAPIVLELSCPQCGAAFQMPVDIGAFLWSELSEYARGLIDEVDVLASRYGWTEGEILSLPAARRRHYLGCAG